MSFGSRFFGSLWHLPPALARDIAVEPVRIPMRDGAELLADRYYSRRAARQPVLLIRSCYGRGNLFRLFALLFAERGLQVVLQSCRGTSGSQGVFRPFFDEQPDGEDTVAWIERQPWFTGQLALWGASYLGNTAWAVANSKAAPQVQAMGLHVTLTNFRDRTYAFGGFTLEASIGWTLTMQNVIRTTGMNVIAALLGARKTRGLAQQAIDVLPLRKADRVVAPEGIAWWQDWMDHAEPNDPWWDPVDYGAAAQTIPPTVMVAGWHDIFLPWQLKDFVNAQRAGRDIRIVIGPWMHAAFPGMAESVRQAVSLFQEQFGLGLRNAKHGASKPGTSRSPVRLFLMGAGEWRDYPSWPIPGSGARRLYLHTNGVLSNAPPSSGDQSAFDYDPSSPTPSLHGVTLEGRSGSGDMAELESRPDVLLFTAEPLAADLDAIGPVSAEIYLRSNTGHTDVYLCLCDVAPDSRSINVCDGYTRLRPDSQEADQAIGSARKVSVEFWPTAYRFRRGHRIRVIVAGGAHPRYARNLGSGECLGDAHTMVVAHREILHGPAHPSAITLTVGSA